jgi:hypothetical protein
MSDPRDPAHCQINTRVGSTELSHAPGQRATLDDIGAGGVARNFDGGKRR